MIDPVLIRQVKTGKPEAFEKLVKLTSKRGLSIAYGVLQNTLDAEDVLQEAYVQVYLNINKLKSAEAFYVWFGKIVTHLAFKRSKEKGRFKTISLQENYEGSISPPDQPDEQLITKEEYERLKTGLDTLPDEYRAALILKEWEDFSYQEISKILEIPLGTVKSRIYNARKLLSGYMKRGTE